MATQEALDLVKTVDDPDFQRLLPDLDESAEQAQAEVRTRLASGDLKWLPAAFRAEATADLDRVTKASALFHAEMAKVYAEQGQRKRFLAVYDAYSLSVGALQTRAAQLGGLADAGVGTLATAIVAFLLLLYKNTAESVKKLEKELEQLERDLQTARKKVTEAKAQGIINGLLSVVTLFLPHVGLLGRVLIGVAKVGINAVVDEAFGPKGATVSHSVQHSLFEIAENYPGLKEAGQKFIKVGSGAWTALSDLAEIELAEKIVAALQARGNEIEKVFNRLLKNLTPMAQQAPRLQKALVETQRKVAEARTRAADAQAEYKALRELIQKGP